MKLEMKDSPGQLVAALKPISDVGGNIRAVIHQRDPDVDGDTLNVQIVLELPEGRLENLIGLLKEQDVHIQRIDEERLLLLVEAEQRLALVVARPPVGSDLDRVCEMVSGVKALGRAQRAAARLRGARCGHV